MYKALYTRFEVIKIEINQRSKFYREMILRSAMYDSVSDEIKMFVRTLQPIS